MAQEMASGKPGHKDTNFSLKGAKPQIPEEHTFNQEAQGSN